MAAIFAELGLGTRLTGYETIKVGSHFEEMSWVRENRRENGSGRRLWLVCGGGSKF